MTMPDRTNPWVAALDDDDILSEAGREFYSSPGTARVFLARAEPQGRAREAMMAARERTQRERLLRDKDPMVMVKRDVPVVVNAVLPLEEAEEMYKAAESGEFGKKEAKTAAEEAAKFAARAVGRAYEMAIAVPKMAEDTLERDRTPSNMALRQAHMMRRPIRRDDLSVVGYDALVKGGYGEVRKAYNSGALAPTLYDDLMQTLEDKRLAAVMGREGMLTPEQEAEFAPDAAARAEAARREAMLAEYPVDEVDYDLIMAQGLADAEAAVDKERAERRARRQMVDDARRRNEERLARQMGEDEKAEMILGEAASRWPVPDTNW